mmetsp:Transcript_42250/g.99210  ORF Transcript_42250/g.99210 Transcript_42250/m.99210 type:complete len:255 (-) Transcript_42250:141-905(-)
MAIGLQWWSSSLFPSRWCRCWRGLRVGSLRQVDPTDVEQRAEELAEVMLEEESPVASEDQGVAARADGSQGLTQVMAMGLSPDLPTLRRQSSTDTEPDLGLVEVERFDRQVTGEWLHRREALQALHSRIASDRERAQQQTLMRLAERRRMLEVQQQQAEQMDREVEMAFVMSMLRPERWNYNYVHQEGDSECRICLEEYVCDEEIVRLPCFHYAHTQCMEKWLRRSANCPVCRTSLHEVAMLAQPQAEGTAEAQ